METTRPRIYRVSPLNILTISGLLMLLTAVGGVVVFRLLPAGDTPAAIRGILVFWVLILVWVWVTYLKIPVTITRNPDNTLVFWSPLATTRLNPEDVLSVKTSSLASGFLHLRHKRGALRLVIQMSGLYELIGLIKEFNPAVEVKG